MTDEEREAVKYLENSLAGTVTHKMMLERIKNLIKKRDRTIKAMAKELTNLLEATEEEIIERFTRR